MRSVRGFNYILVTYCYDANAILVRPIRSRKGSDLVKAIEDIHSYLTERGYKPAHQILDNEISTSLKNYLKANQVIFQLVPPNVHRKNAAEQAIRTFKNHFIAILCAVHPDFPLSLWCHLLPQTEMTLNMLRLCRLNPKLSAYTALEGEFSYNHTLLVPLGAKVIVHDLHDKRLSWAPHRHYGWLISPAMEHYRCFKVCNPKTKAVAIAYAFH